jgi:hypothetical protein
VGHTRSFAIVASGAATGRITPGTQTTPAPGYDVINGKVLLRQHLAFLPVAQPDAAINTTVAIPLEHGPATPTRASTRHIDVPLQANDGWDMQGV